MDPIDLLLAIAEPSHLSLAGEVVIGAYLMLVHREIRALRRYVSDCPSCVRSHRRRSPGLPSELAALVLPVALGALLGASLMYRPG